MSVLRRAVGYGPSAPFQAQAPRYNGLPVPQLAASGLGGARDVFAAAALSAAEHPRVTPPAPTVSPSELPPTAVKNAVVIGAGPAGLMAALELLQNGTNVTIIEQRDAYTRPIHFNLRAGLLHHIAEKCPAIVPKILERVGPIERIEIIDGRVKNITAEHLEELRRAKPDREIAMTAGGLKTSRPGARIPTPDAQLASFGGRAMMQSPAVGQILVTDLEKILYAELERRSKEPTTGRAPSVTILRNHRPDLVPAEKDNTKVTAYEVRAENGPDGRPKWVPTGKRLNLGTPDLIVVAEGANSETRKSEAARRMAADRTVLSEGAGYIAASIDGAAKTDKAPNGGLIRRRYDEVTDPATGKVHGVRQVVVGHAKHDASWVLVEVPPFIKLEGKAAIEKYYREQAALVLERPVAEVQARHVSWGPNAFVVQQFISETAVRGNNLILIGDAVGNAHFLTSGGMNTACIPHSYALQTLLENLRDGMDRKQALKRYNLRAIAGTKEWIRAGNAEFGRQRIGLKR